VVKVTYKNRFCNDHMNKYCRNNCQNYGRLHLDFFSLYSLSIQTIKVYKEKQLKKQNQFVWFSFFTISFLKINQNSHENVPTDIMYLNFIKHLQSVYLLKID